MFLKGHRILYSIGLLLITTNISVKAQDVDIRDTVATAYIKSDKNPVELTGLKRLERKDFLKGAALMSSPDLIKVLQNSTGVSSGMELFSGLYVHGGDGSSNLLLIEGVPLYQISHLGGLFSSYNTDIISNVDFYKSGFPSKFGGSISSVVDAKSNEGSMDMYEGSVSIGLIDGRIQFSGPIIKEKLSFNLALRRTWLDAVVSPILAISNKNNKEKTNAAYSFFDTNAKLTYLASKNDKINLNFFAGTDWLDYDRSEEKKVYGKDIYYANSGETLNIKWGNIAASTDWTHYFSNQSRIETIIYYSKAYSDIDNAIHSYSFENEVVIPDRYSERATSSIKSLGIKSEYIQQIENHKLFAGLEYKKLWYNPTHNIGLVINDADIYNSNSQKEYNSDVISAYVEDEINFNKFKINAGLRLDALLYDGGTFFSPQPRISASYSFTKDLIIKASYEKMSQFSHQLSSIFLDIPTNIWIPATAKIQPSNSDQFVIGAYYKYSKNWHFDLSAYYKDFSNCIINTGSSTLFPNLNNWEDEFGVGIGRSYGTEIEAVYVSENWNASAAYTLSWSERKFEQFYPHWFYDRFDNRHKLTLNAGFRPKDNIELNATWQLHSGNRINIPEHITSYYPRGASLQFSKPYNMQMPTYHRLDLACKIHTITKRGNEGIWTISVYNVYCRMNPFLMRYGLDSDGTKPIVYQLSLVPIIPSVSYTLKF